MVEETVENVNLLERQAVAAIVGLTAHSANKQEVDNLSNQLNEQRAIRQVISDRLNTLMAQADATQLHMGRMGKFEAEMQEEMRKHRTSASPQPATTTEASRPPPDNLPDSWQQFIVETGTSVNNTWSTGASRSGPATAPAGTNGGSPDAVFAGPAHASGTNGMSGGSQ